MFGVNIYEAYERPKNKPKIHVHNAIYRFKYAFKTHGQNSQSPVKIPKMANFRKNVDASRKKVHTVL